MILAVSILLYPSPYFYISISPFSDISRPIHPLVSLELSYLHVKRNDCARALTQGTSGRTTMQPVVGESHMCSSKLTD